MPVSIDLNNSIIKELNLYDFQEDAVKKLYEHFIINDSKNGLLVMPTGSGKTRTATYFLLKNMISSGYQVIWLAHRHMLIEQTADSFYMHSPLAKQGNKDLEKIKITCVSGEHSTIRATEKDDNIVILSVQAVCRNLDYLKKILSKRS